MLDNTENKKTGIHIYKWRAMRGMKQSELAKLINISASTLSKYENGKVNPGLTQLHQIAYHLKVSFDQLMQDPVDAVSHFLKK